MNTDETREYERRYNSHLVQIAERLAAHIGDLIGSLPRIDRLQVRAKSPHSFAAKAATLLGGTELKYPHPLEEIQDQIGARIVVYYAQDVDVARRRVEKYLRPVERVSKVPEHHWAFGYFGVHLLLALPADVIPEAVDPKLVPGFFELQIKTLFQHAWSVANHDLTYKPSVNLTGDHERRCAYAAAQAWGADEIFKGLWGELGDGDAADRRTSDSGRGSG